MTWFQRLQTILSALFLLLCACLILLDPGNAYMIICDLVCLSLTLRGVKELWFYFTMARHMVGGKIILYIGILLLDFSLFTASVSEIPRPYIRLYLVILFGFAGVIDMMNALNARRLGAPSWKLNTFTGVFRVATAVVCLYFFRSPRVMELICCISLFYSAGLRLISAFRRTAIVYIQ